jgi:FMN phosphatase YigB (HAD superfamily)
MAIRTILLDFGGCIDAPGIHTRALFWRAFSGRGTWPESGRAVFQEAYTLADRRMMESGEAKALGLGDFNRLNAELIASALGLAPGAGHDPADLVTNQMRAYLEDSRLALAPLAKRFPLGVISNFTGNLKVILEEFSLLPLFSSVTESFYEGCSKPDRKLFERALGRQAFPPAEILYVGDNPVNDIEPAKALGLKTALIYENESRECGANAYVKSLRELEALVERL